MLSMNVLMSMNTKRFALTACVLGFLCLLFMTLPACRGGEKVPRNVILLISDGCGFNHLRAASLYEHGQPEGQVYWDFPVRLAMSTHPHGSPGYDPETVWKSFAACIEGPTDSAASATAMATGVKTYNGAVNVDPDRARLQTSFERAEKDGKATGVVSSVMFSHATPACFASHSPNRGWYPAIANQMIKESGLDVIMGCGHPLYDNQGNLSVKPSYRYVGGEKTWEAVRSGQAGGDADGDGTPDPWTLIETREDFQSLMSGPTAQRVIGLPHVYTTLQQERMGNALAPPYEEPFLEHVPTLTEMMVGALNVLDEDRDGFFLMVEGGAVDWAGHDNQTGRMIEEQIEFDRAVQAAVDWVETHSRWSQTLIIVTSDHETGYLTGPGSGEPDAGDNGSMPPVWKPLVSRGRGEMPDVQWNITGHTNSLVPFFARGAASQQFLERARGVDPVHGPFLDNTDIGRVLLSFFDDD